MQNKHFPLNSKVFNVGEKWFDGFGNEYFIIGVEDYPYNKVIFKDGEEIRERDQFSFQTYFFHHSAFEGFDATERKILAYARSIGLGKPGAFTVEHLIDSFRNLRASNTKQNAEMAEIRKEASARAYEDALAWAQDEAIRERIKNMTVQEFANFMSTGD